MFLDQAFRTLRRHLEAVIAALPENPLPGLEPRELFAGVRRVEFARLANNDKIVLDGDVARVELAFYEQALCEGRNHRVTLALCTLYFLHEAFHLCQNVGAYAMVKRLRATGDEDSLMHIDLAADHAAAVVAALAVPDWTLGWLKKLQGRALLGFPCGPKHTAAARRRKARRLVSVRAEHVLRRRGWHSAGPAPGGYLFVSFSDGDGQLLALESGPTLPAVIATSRISRREATVLTRAADPDTSVEGLRAVDRILLKLQPIEGSSCRLLPAA